VFGILSNILKDFIGGRMPPTARWKRALPRLFFAGEIIGFFALHDDAIRSG
jgi:hypothetical protein